MTRISQPPRSRQARRQLRARVDELLGDVEFPKPFNIAGFCQALGERRHRDIRLMPSSRRDLGDVSGVWIAVRSGTDYVFYDASTGPLHQENVILHELGHMMFGHHCEGEFDDGTMGLLQRLFPAFTPDVLRELGGSVFGRSGYTEPAEREAEEFAAAVWERAGEDRTLVQTSRVHDDRDRRVLTRLAAALGPWVRTR